MLDTTDADYSGDSPTRVTTSRDRANGLFAQSVGGGGGKGSMALALSASNKASLSVAVGGSGGNGGAGGGVTLTSDAEVATSGDQSSAILAQSVGGGGGNGGLAVAGSLGNAIDILGADLRLRIHERATLELSFDTLLASDQQTYLGSAQLRVEF